LNESRSSRQDYIFEQRCHDLEAFKSAGGR
jgi:hypothetical protein